MKFFPSRPFSVFYRSQNNSDFLPNIIIPSKSTFRGPESAFWHFQKLSQTGLKLFIKSHSFPRPQVHIYKPRGDTSHTDGQMKSFD